MAREVDIHSVGSSHVGLPTPMHQINTQADYITPWYTHGNPAQPRRPGIAANSLPKDFSGQDSPCYLAFLKKYISQVQIDFHKSIAYCLMH